MQTENRHLRKRIYNTVPGFMQGTCPKGPVVTVWHKQSGRTGFWLYWNGSWHSSFGQQDLYKLFGISPKVKKTGYQQGYPSEPVIQAVWRYLGKRYNEGDTDVTYSKTQPDLTKTAIKVPTQYKATDDDIRNAVQLASTLRRSGSGESRAHKTLKNMIAEHPDIIGATEVKSVFIEHQYPSGDRVDLLFESSGSKWTVVEVELEGLPETVTGLFQAVKYRALQQAVLRTEKRQGSVSAVLVARSIPAEVMTIAHMLDIETVEVLDQER